MFGWFIATLWCGIHLRTTVTSAVAGMKERVPKAVVRGQVYSREVEFTQIRLTSPSKRIGVWFWLHRTHMEKSMSNVVMNPALQSYFSEYCMLKFISGRNSTAYRVNSSFHRNESE